MESYTTEPRTTSIGDDTNWSYPSLLLKAASAAFLFKEKGRVKPAQILVYDLILLEAEVAYSDFAQVVSCVTE